MPSSKWAAPSSDNPKPHRTRHTSLEAQIQRKRGYPLSLSPPASWLDRRRLSPKGRPRTPLSGLSFQDKETGNWQLTLARGMTQVTPRLQARAASSPNNTPCSRHTRNPRTSCSQGPNHSCNSTLQTWASPTCPWRGCLEASTVESARADFVSTFPDASRLPLPDTGKEVRHGGEPAQHRQAFCSHTWEQRFPMSLKSSGIHWIITYRTPLAI